jgi:CubicO group peptidase (beta-lactamase class C family)
MSSSSNAPDDPGPTGLAAKIRAIVEIPDDGAAPGLAVGVFKGGKTAFVAAGLADIAAQRRPNADTLYYSGSIAKQFTALAVTQLALAGEIVLGDDIRKFIPEMPLRSPPITVQMLLHHTSGLPNNARLLPIAGYRHAGDATRSETLRMLIQYPQTAFPPGATFEYSNGGYLLLSEIVERVAGTPFADHVGARILQPLGMSRSGVLQGALPADPNLARGYAPKDASFVLSEDIPRFGGAGAMMLTVNDLARYHHDIAVGGKVWTPDVRRLMTEPGRYADGSPIILPVPGHIFGYASGLMLSRDWILHGGNYAGFQALFAWLPDRGLGIALLCNRSDVEPIRLAARILDAVDPGLPAIDAPRFTLAGPEGRFVSDTLAAVYDIVRAGEDLEVTITPPGGLPGPSQTFARSGDGVYALGPLVLTFDPDHRGFQIRNENVVQRFRRAAAA